MQLRLDHDEVKSQIYCPVLSSNEDIAGAYMAECLIYCLIISRIIDIS